MKPFLRAVRDGAALVEFPLASDEEANRAAVSLGRRLRDSAEPGLRDAVPGARTLLLLFDPETLAPGRLERLAATASDEASPAGSRTIRIPAVYDGEDLAAVARDAGMTAEEFARRHAAARYRVAFLGFQPGFAYLAGLPPALAAPRLATPRPAVPAGSLAIGGIWTGVYPAASPGGWRLIGRTAARLFDAAANPPALLEPGDHVEFERAERLQPPPSVVRKSSPPGRPIFRVLTPGLSTTLQGAPHHGNGASGVPAGGAMDALSLALANALVGNAGGAAALEVTLAGPELEVLEEAVLALAGAPAPFERNGAAVPPGDALRVSAGDRVRIGRIARGARAYLAVRGAFAGEPGLRLAAGDVLRTADEPAERPGRALPGSALPRFGDELRIRVLPGPEADAFPASELERFLASAWRVTPESDRRGLRLSGEPLAHAGAPEIPPSGTLPGSIQVPGSGLPIVLGPDGPVTGGYPRIATAASVDLPALGQARPGAIVRFERISLEEAVRLRTAAGVP